MLQTKDTNLKKHDFQICYYRFKKEKRKEKKREKETSSTTSCELKGAKKDEQNVSHRAAIDISVFDVITKSVFLGSSATQQAAFKCGNYRTIFFSNGKTKRPQIDVTVTGSLHLLLSCQRRGTLLHGRRKGMKPSYVTDCVNNGNISGVLVI